MNEFNQQFRKTMNFVKLTKVQEEVLEKVTLKRDMVVRSDTGTGKTHAFLFAIGERIDLELKQTQAIILAPTRELAMQIYDFAKDMQKVDDALTIDLAIGGMDNNRLQTKLEKQPHIIISTPGKFLDILSMKLIRLDYVQLLILDEMDMMLDYGFIEDVNSIANHFKNDTNLYLFSATLPHGLRSFIKRYLRNHLEITVEKDEMMKPQIDHILINHRHRDIHEELLNLITSINPLLGIIFVNTKDQAQEIARFLQEYGINCVEIHGGLQDRRRKQVLREIKNSKVEFIVASDLAARGIDLPEISHVINIGLPSHDLSFYTHRSGRTGRSGRQGYAISLVSDKDESAIRRLMKEGIHFEYKRVTEDGLVDARPFIHTRTRQKSVDPEVVKILNRKNKKVKPGYKKKRQQEIQRIQSQNRRAKIREDIRKQKKERAKQKQREFDV
ncbi:DEAD/DEAH box helicase [Erysipelothrix urinaevulpis]|uniref:DEAD/DEAH box helicase n=1 Tax=Erysipelothrix urinaevulpis TaxID=2683717 RepID=UPI001F3EBDC7|nr:DEAD/DEAH box helicase [Erysipelothrix urinaevulpis]